MAASPESVSFEDLVGSFAPGSLVDTTRIIADVPPAELTQKIRDFDGKAARSQELVALRDDIANERSRLSRGARARTILAGAVLAGVGIWGAAEVTGAQEERPAVVLVAGIAGGVVGGGIFSDLVASSRTEQYAQRSARRRLRRRES